MAKKHKAKQSGSKKKPTKKKTVSKKKKAKKPAAKKKSKKPSAKKSGEKTAKKSLVKEEQPGEPLGHVTHYFPKVKATAIMIDRKRLATGDTLYFKGHTTHFKQKVESLQINHQPVTEAGEGEEVGIRVKSRTREGDLVFKI